MVAEAEVAEAEEVVAATAEAVVVVEAAEAVEAVAEEIILAGNRFIEIKSAKVKKISFSSLPLLF